MSVSDAESRDISPVKILRRDRLWRRPLRCPHNYTTCRRFIPSLYLERMFTLLYNKTTVYSNLACSFFFFLITLQNNAHSGT